jgi:hypothetical protein
MPGKNHNEYLEQILADTAVLNEAKVNISAQLTHARTLARSIVGKGDGSAEQAARVAEAFPVKARKTKADAEVAA